MEVNVRCPRCFRTFPVHPGWLGRILECPYCAHVHRAKTLKQHKFERKVQYQHYEIVAVLAVICAIVGFVLLVSGYWVPRLALMFPIYFAIPKRPQ